MLDVVSDGAYMLDEAMDIQFIMTSGFILVGATRALAHLNWPHRL
jgi:hypothetical protein